MPGDASRFNGKKGGRPRGSKSINAEKAREYLVQRVTDELDPVLTSQLEAAKGMYYEKKTKEGVIKVYQEKPDINASKYLLDQTIGRAKESLDLNTEKPMQIEASIMETINKIYGKGE